VIFLSTAQDSIFGHSLLGSASTSERIDFSTAKSAVFAASFPFGGRRIAVLRGVSYRELERRSRTPG